MYTVLVENIGTVLETTIASEAAATYLYYVERAKAGQHTSVHLFKDGEPLCEHLNK